MPSIAEIRNMYPDAKNASDEEIIGWVAKRSNISLPEAARYFDYDLSGGQTSKRFGASIDRYQAGLYGTSEALAGAVGLDSASNYLAKQRQQNEAQADISSGRAKELGAIESYKDVKGLGDFGNYATGLAIQSAPYLAEALTGGVIGRGVMSGTRLALEEATVAYRTAQASGDVVAAARAKTAIEAAQKSLSLGSNAGVVAASYPSSVGDVLSNQREQSGTTDAASAFGLGTIYSGLNVFGVEGALGRGQLFRNPLNLLDNVSGAKGVLARTAATGTTAAVKEGVQETLQEGVNQAGRMAVDPTEQFFNEKSNERFKESFIGGATLGGIIGGGAGGWRRSESFVPGANTAANPQTGQTATNEVEQAFQQNQTITSVGTTPGFDMAAQMSGTAGRVDPLTGRSSLVGTQAGTTPEFDMAAQMSGTADRVNPLAGRSSLVDQTAAPITAPAVTGGTTDIAQSQAATQQQNQQQTQADFATQQQQKETERVIYMADRVGLPKPEGQRWDFFGKPVFGPAIQEAAKATADLVGSLKGFQNQITRAINVANEQTGGKLVNVNFNPLKATDSVRKTFEKVAEVAAKFQIAHVGSVEEAAQILEQLSQSTKGAQLEQLNAIHQALTGTDTTGYIASQQTKGAKNGQTLQTTTGLGTVPIQSGTGEGSGTNTGDVQPSGVQSLLTGSEPQGQTGQQTGQPSGEGIRTGTSVTSDLSGSQPATGQVNEQVTSGLGEGQVSNQPQQTATGTVGEQAVQNGPRVYSPTIGYYASDLSHISSERRIEIILDLFNKVLATTKGAGAETRAEILRLALLEQFPQADIADLVGMSEAAVQKQLERMGIKMDRTVDVGGYIVTDPDIALKIVNEAANYRSAEFPDGIGEGELAGLYATRYESEDKPSQSIADEIRENGEDLASFGSTGVKGDRSAQMAEELYSKEGRNDQSMGIVKKGGSQGAVGVQAKNLFKKAEKLQTELTKLTPGTPEHTEKSKQLADVWDKYAKTQTKLEQEENTEVEGEEDAVQVESADEGNVRKPARGGKKVGEGNAKPEKPAKQTKQAKTEAVPEEVKTPEEQWNELRTLAPELPAYADLNKDQRIRFDDLANRGKANLAAVVNQIVTAPATEIATEIATEKRQTISDVVAEEQTEPVVEEQTEPVVEEELTAEEIIEESPEAAEINPEQQAILEEPVAALPEAQVVRLENHYGVKRGTSEFFTKLQEDVTAYATKGAQAVAAAIRDIVKAIHAGVLATAMVFNPSLMTKNSEVLVIAPRTVSQVREVKAEVPAVAKANMSKAAQEAYSTIYPSIAAKLKAENKFFVLTDKPNARVFIFNPDGSLFLQKKVLIGKTVGDYYKGNTDKVENRITPAGLFTMGLRDAKRGGGEAQTAGEYDFGKVFVLDKAIDGEYSVTLFHSVWTKEKDAQQRLAALQKEGAADSRYSFGCINVDKATYGSLVANNLQQMDGAALFIVPDKQELVGEFLTGATAQNKANKDELTRTPFTPKTETVTTTTPAPASGQATPSKVSVVGREEDVKFGKNVAPTKPYTAQSLIAELKAFMRVDSLGRNVIIVDDVAELEDMRDQAIGWSNDKAFGWTRSGKAILVASRIQEGQGRAKFMHEVGSHLGLDRMLAEKDIVSLAGQISKWADLNDNSKESVLARKAIERVGNANVADEDVMSELIAYFVEEAMQSGVDPSAAAKMTGAFGSWFRTLWAGFKNAVRKLGFKPESLTAQDVVNMAYGAARLEVAGTWHGTAAEFRKFNHQYMGTGEGAQAYGWGSYLAQRYGIGEGYRVADIRRKGVSAYQKELSKYIGFYAAQNIINPVTLEVIVAANDRILGTAALAKELHDVGVDYINVLDNKGVAHTINFATPAGSMMRVDVNMQDNETLNWDEKISDMPQEVQDNLAKIKDSLETEGLLEGYLDKLNIDWTDLTGADLYKTILKQAHEADAKIFHAIPGSDRMSAKKATSLLLDSLGIKGLKFLDARSRDKDEKQIMFNGKTYSREDLINMRKANGAPIPLDQIATLRHVLRHGVEETIKEYQAKVDKREKQLFDVYRESAERYKVPFNEAEELAKAKQQALNTYEAKQIAFLKSANVKVVGNKDVTRNLVVFNDANIFRAATNIGTDKEQVKFGINPAATVDETINRLPPFVRTSTRSLTTTLLYQAKNAVYASAITEDVVKMASKYMKSANDYLNAQYARQATRIQFEKRIDNILSSFEKLPENLKGVGENSVNKFISDSTISGKWGYYPGEQRVGTELFTVDPDMKLRFDAFGKDSDAQNVIKDVFEHGYEALMLKKKAVEAAIDREFAERERATLGDPDQMAELAKEKKLLLAREAKIRGIDVSSPYAYLGRYGDYVVAARSAEYKHYEERAKLDDWDVKQAKQWLQDHVSDPDHYLVQFAETQAEADDIAAKLQATGKYDIMPEDAGVKEADESYTGGGDIYLAVARLRNLVQRQIDKGDVSSTSAHSLNKMVGDLYLTTVGEASVRKTLMQRKKVAGFDGNMMRNLATNGRADAHFLSTMEHNDAITDSMERMRTEAKRHHREAMPIYNELIRRQANSMEYKTPAPLSIALNRMNTLWSLTFSPAYYMQQILQTAVISVPYIGARIGYGNAVSQVNRGYKDIVSLVKGLGVNDNIDFSKAPADVRDMLNKLVGMGKIDISMDANERATADEKGIFAKVMYKMQGVNNRIESVNRSVAAIAAYRGYLARYGNNNTEAATQYAAQVVSDTHGSYDGFNTPRILAGNIGRVVGQFRRFQIIQLSMLARLMHNAFKGASADEKMVARKALGFITAQMAVVGGAMAVPFVSQIAWMMSKILGDPDEPDNFEFKLRRLIDNKVVSDLLLRGVPAALGVDVSDKLGMGRVASILPFSQGDLTSRSGAEKIIVAAMGPSASMSMKFADAFGMVLKGDYYKGLEMAMPNGFANVMKAGRFTTEGITMRNGDLVLKPEDYGMVDAAFQAVGLPTNIVTDRQFTQQVKAEYDKFYAQRSTDIKGDYVKAYRDNDAKGMSQAREEFQQMEESRVANGYKRQPMSDLLKAPMAAMKRERGVIGGVETSKQNRRFVELASQI